MDAAGVTGPTRGQAQGSNWVRTSHGLYVPAWADRERPEQRIVQAAAVLPEYGAVTGWAALRWCGGHWFDGLAPDGSRAPVTLAVSSHDIRPQSGIAVSAEGLDPRHIITIDGVRITAPAYSVLFEMRHARSFRDAVRVMDMAAYNDLASIKEVGELLAVVGPRTGVPQARNGLSLSNENAWSPREVDLRMVWVIDADFPPPLCNVPIFDRRGNHIGTPDIFDPVAGVVGEYDGALHLEGAQRTRDVRREERFRSRFLEYFVMLAGDANDLSSLLARMTGARARAKFLPESQRSWTIEPPPWWRPTLTVEQRRSLDSELRDRLLRHRLRAS